MAALFLPLSGRAEVVNISARGHIPALSSSAGSLAVGDVNGDGFPDLTIPKQDGVYVVFGTAAGWPAANDLSHLDGRNGFRIDTGTPAYDPSHSYVVATGDVNHDGYADIIIGAPYSKPDGKNVSGSTYVIFGGRGPWPAVVYLQNLNGVNGFRLDGASPLRITGWAVASGDVNGDGFDDIIVSETALVDPHTGNNLDSSHVYVVFGKASGWAPSQPLIVGEGNLIDGKQGVRFDAALTAKLGDFMAVGDVNGDGYADLVLSGTNPGDTPDEHQRFGPKDASVYVVFGRASGWAATQIVDTGEGNLIDGQQGVRFDAPGDVAFGQIFGVGDVNGDGKADIVIGAPLAPGNSPSPGDDVPNDGQFHEVNVPVSQLIAQLGQRPLIKQGYVYVIFGKASGWSATQKLDAGRNYFINGQQGVRLDGVSSGDNAGSWVGVRDVNGDGYADIIVSAAGANGGKGCSYVVYGKASGWGMAQPLNTNLIDGHNNGLYFDQMLDPVAAISIGK